jgi:DNA-directed RNA polymerase subunit beta
MEVWALEAYGAAYTLQEMLTIKSDDTGRAREGLRGDRQGREHRRAVDPESFKVLLKEMQSLALDVNVVSEEGTRARDGRRGRRPAARRRGARHRPLRRPRPGTEAPRRRAETPADAADGAEARRRGRGASRATTPTDAEYIEDPVEVIADGDTADEE